MNCREKILSEDYMSILLDYVPEEADQEDEAFCYQQVWLQQTLMMLI